MLVTLCPYLRSHPYSRRASVVRRPLSNEVVESEMFLAFIALLAFIELIGFIGLEESWSRGVVGSLRQEQV